MLVSAPPPLIPSAAPTPAWPWLVFVLVGLELFTAPKIQHLNKVHDPVFLTRLDPGLGGRQSQALYHSGSTWPGSAVLGGSLWDQEPHLFKKRPVKCSSEPVVYALPFPESTLQREGEWCLQFREGGRHGAGQSHSLTFALMLVQFSQWMGILRAP